jgi:arylsulfatase A-like enzyme
LVKQQRLKYREFPDYRERLGAFEWLLPPDAHSDHFVADRACWWIDAAPKAEPLFLQIGFPGPHPPYDPTPEYLRRYMGKHLPIAKVTEADLAGQPKPFHVLREHNVEIDHDSVVHQFDPSDEHRHRQRAHYLANVTMIDDAVGRVVSALEKKGYLDDCIIVFTSDHGDCLGDHGHSQKWTMYDQVTKVPMILWAPGKVPASQKSDALIQAMDIVPWLLTQARANLPEGMEAVSIEPVFKNPEWPGREAVFCEQGRDNILTDVEFMTMVRTTQWKLVHFLNEEFGQLFDLQNDPEEENNLWASASHSEVRQEMMGKLLQWRMQSQIKTQNVFREHR